MGQNSSTTENDEVMQKTITVLQVTVAKGDSTSYCTAECTYFSQDSAQTCENFLFHTIQQISASVWRMFPYFISLYLELLSYFPVPTPIFSIQSIFQTLKQFGMYTRRYRMSEFLIVWLLFNPAMLSSGQWTHWTPTLVIRSISLTRSAASDTVSAHKNGNLFSLCLAFSLLNNNP